MQEHGLFPAAHHQEPEALVRGRQQHHGASRLTVRHPPPVLQQYNQQQQQQQTPQQQQHVHHSHQPPLPRCPPPVVSRGDSTFMHRMLTYFTHHTDWSCGPASIADMVSRRRILSRSRDDLNLDSFVEDEEDVWYHKDKLFKDHIQEVLDKWEQIDDEIWAKVIVVERNRRVAKAYARAPVLTVNGSDEGFDGFRIGMCGFDNPMRDSKTEEVKRHIGHGVKIKMDEAGNILVKRVAKSNVYVKTTGDENAVSADALKLPNGGLELEKPVKLFDIKKFQSNVVRELRRAYPERRKLEAQCISAVAFVKNEPELLDCPCWLMVINMVALEFLKARIPPVKRLVAPSNAISGTSMLGMDMRNRPRIPIPDEDPYSVAGQGGNGSGGGGGNSSGSSSSSAHNLRRGEKERPPKLPPRDTSSQGHPPHNLIPKPDYDDFASNDSHSKGPFARESAASKPSSKDRKYDDPYYCGLRARIPNFAKAAGGKGSKEESSSRGRMFAAPPLPAHPLMWHARSFDSGMESDMNESLYSHIYGRFPPPPRGFMHPPPHGPLSYPHAQAHHVPHSHLPSHPPHPLTSHQSAPLMYVGEWE